MKNIMFLGLVLMVGLTKIWANEVLYFWSGAITANTGKVNAVLQNPAEKVRLVVGVDKVFSQPVYSAYAPATAEHGNTVSLLIENLQPSTRYYYCLEIDGVKDKNEKHIGSFTTFFNEPQSFKFVAGSCNFFPNNRVYDKMRAENPLFLLMPGDLHYANPSAADVEPHRVAYEEKVLQQPRESRFLKDIPIAYIWDDHDFCGDNNDGTSGCGLAAYKAYTEYVPYYPLGAPEGSHSIYQAFTVGRLRFILTDLRSERREGDIMSLEQKNWFKKEVLAARDQGQMICWVSSVSYSGTRSDNWGAYTASRTELANFFRDNQVINLFIICGDAHMLAIDNGTHADFSEGKNNPNLYPILQSAALNNVGSDKGGEYSEGGTFPNPPFSSQWSTVEVTDHGGDDICIKFTCFRMDLLTKRTRIMTSYQFCRTLNPPTVHAPQLSHIISATPVGNKITLELDYSGKAQVKLINYQGKLLINQCDVQINHSYQLDATNLLTSGIYYVIVETEQGNFVAKMQYNQ
jgi:alkaline phosphatase D